MEQQSGTDRERDFCAWLRRARIAQDLTQEALAEAVGCATQTVRSFENGRRRPSRELAARLAAVLQVAADERAAFIRLARTSLAAEPEQEPVSAQAALLAPPRIGRPIPLPADALIGRSGDLQRLRQALITDRRRLVTLLGPGGIGKTRLALQAAADLAGHFADGVAVVLLAAVSDPAEVVTAIAEALGCPPPGAQPPERVLLAFLRERALLLVLDNLEHLLGARQDDRTSALLNAILREAPEVALLCTSRERLRLRAESVVELDGLGLPPDDRPLAIERAEATLLFLERARQVMDTFALTPENRGAVAHICRLLGGAPLGIELAAAWVRVMSCAEIAAEMARSIDFLALDARDLPPRHRSQRAVIDHSWQLLTAEEQQVLLRLAVFRGGFRREAAEAICANLSGPQLPAQHGSRLYTAPLLPMLSALVDKSLLRRTTDHDGATRYDLHEVVRQYLAARLATDPVAETDARHRHAIYYDEWLAVQDGLLKSVDQKEALRAITADIGNVRAAWRSAVQGQNVSMVRRMTECLHWFYEVRGWNSEGVTLFGAGAAALHASSQREDATPETLAAYWLLVFLEGWHAVRADPAFALPRLQAGLAGQRRANDPWALALSLAGIGFVRMFAGDYDNAQAALDEGYALADTHCYPWLRSMMLVVRGVLEALRSDGATAKQYLSLALPVARAIGDPRHIALTLSYLGLAALSLEQYDEVERVCREALAIAQEHQDRYQTSQALQSLGRVAVVRGAYAEGEAWLRTSLAIAQEMGDRWLEAQTLGCLAQLAAATGDGAGARTQQLAALQAAAAAPQPIALDQLTALAELVLSTEPDAALTALAYVRQHPLSRPATRQRAAEQWRDIWHLLPADRCLAAEAAAHSFPYEQPAALLALFLPAPELMGAV